jgi:hypothetical protein
MAIVVMPLLFISLFALNRESSRSPTIKTGLKMSDVGKAHLLKHVRRKGRPSTAGSI